MDVESDAQDLMIQFDGEGRQINIKPLPFEL